MRDLLAGITTVMVLGMSVSSLANAEGMSIGEFEYRNSCIQCHGESGKGDGPVTDFLSGGVPPDLTMLKKNNGGVFPIQKVFEVIEGSRGATATIHGTRDMPMWGSRYMARVEAPQDDGSGYSPEESRLYARTRILALAEYLSTLQED